MNVCHEIYFHMTITYRIKTFLFPYPISPLGVDVLIKQTYLDTTLLKVAERKVYKRIWLVNVNQYPKEMLQVDVYFEHVKVSSRSLEHAFMYLKFQLVFHY